jgi:hypothetical protein
MNWGTLIVIVIITLFIINIYLVTSLTQVNKILNRINPKENRKFFDGIDISELVKALKHSKELNETERQLLKRVLFWGGVAITLFIVYVILAFGTDW